MHDLVPPRSLSPWPAEPDPGRTVHVESDVVFVGHLRLAGMLLDLNADGCPIGPRVIAQPSLDLEMPTRAVFGERRCEQTQAEDSGLRPVTR